MKFINKKLLDFGMIVVMIAGVGALIWILLVFGIDFVNILDFYE